MKYYLHVLNLTRVTHKHTGTNVNTNVTIIILITLVLINFICRLTTVCESTVMHKVYHKCLETVTKDYSLHDSVVCDTVSVPGQNPPSVVSIVH